MRFLFRWRKRRNEELNEEIQGHLELAARENMESGLAPKDAQTAARHEFGSIALAEEVTRDMWGGRWFADLLQDIRFALRTLRKSPGFTAVAVLTLALGVGANTAIFSFIDAVLLRSIPVKDPQQLVVFNWSARANPKLQGHSSYGDCADQTGIGDCSFSIPFYKTVRAQAGAFSGMAAFAGPLDVDLSGNGAASIVRGLYVSGDFFSTLGVSTFIGRPLTPSDDSPSAPPAIVLNYAYWVRAFGAAPSVLGRTVRLDSTTVTIVGVADPHFTNLTPGKPLDLFMPFSVADSVRGEWWGNEDRLSLAQFSSSLVGNATTTATQTPTASASTPTLPIVTVTTGTNPDFVVTADFNDDNFQDFAVANFTDGTLTLFDGNPTSPGSFGTGTTIPVGAGPTWISTGFFNTKTDTTNTIVDLAVANQTAGTVSILHGNGDGTFTVEPSLTLPSGAGPTAIAVGDFNDDGFADLAVVNRNANTVSIFLGNGDETFQAPTTTLVTGNAPTSIVAQAFNPNAPGIIDLAVTNSTDNTLQIFLGNGKGTFTNGVTYDTGVTPVFVASADVNLDGNLDLVVADSGAATTTNTVGNSVSVFLGNGDGTFILPGGTRMDFAAGTTPTSFVIADFNDDGIPDLLVTASGDDAAALMIGASGGFFNAPIEVPVGTTPDSVATADFNGDGLPDVAISNFGSNTASVIEYSSSLIGLLSSNGVGTQFPNAEYIDIGLKVKATPRVHENGDVSLQFEFTLSSLAGNSLNNIPVVNNQEIHQSVRVHADESALLAGYLAPQTTITLNGTPGIANLPLNGIVGGTTSTQFTNTEVLILVTPRIVDSATRNKEHLIYAGRGQLGGPGSQGPTIQERRGGGFVNPVAPQQQPEPAAAPPQPQPEPTPAPQPQPGPQPQAVPAPVQTPPDQPQTVPPQQSDNTPR